MCSADTASDWTFASFRHAETWASMLSGRWFAEILVEQVDVDRHRERRRVMAEPVKPSNAHLLA
jgi:hypothetical protein